MLDRLPEEELVLKLQVAGAGRRRGIGRILNHERHLDFDLPPWRDRPLEGARELALRALARARAKETQLQLTLDNGSACHHRVKEADVGLFVRPCPKREDQDDSQQQAGIAHSSSLGPVEYRRLWLAGARK